MASKNIKGITIKIGGETTELQKALKGVDQQVYTLNSDLKNLNQALKLDPKNTELLAQKQEVLGRNITATKEKLETLKEAQRQMGDYNSLTDEQKKSYNALSLEIAKSESALKGMQKELKETSGINMDKLKDGLKKVGEVAVDVSKKLAKVTAAVSGALAGVVAAGVKSYAALEQNMGGVETLFKLSDKEIERFAKNSGMSIEEVKNDTTLMNAAIDTVKTNAAQAYKTAGVSANEYMAGVTSFTASLLQSTGGSAIEAANVADMAFRDMSDNANKFGTDMSSIQTAYQGFAKQNYTMLDNLKLGYGGTKTEMERLLKNAEKISGVKYDINNLKDVYEAIHVIQEDLDITGTTAKEASTTISGSVTSMKAAFDNFINGSGSPEQLAQAVSTMLTNVGNAIAKIAPGILSGIVSLIQTLLPQVIALLNSLIPELLTAVTNMINTILTMITQNTSQLATTISTIIQLIINFITANLPLLLQAGITILVTLIKVIIQALIDNLPKIIDTIVTTLINNLPLLLAAAVKLFMALVQAIPQVIIELVKVIPKIAVSTAQALWDNRDKILEAGKKMLLNIRDGITNNLSNLTTKVKEIPGKVKGWIQDGISNLVDVGGNFVKGIWSGISDGLSWIKSKLKSWVGSVVDFCKKLLGIKSPSKVMADQVGKFMGEGVGVGFEEAMDDVEKDMAKSIPIDALVTDVNNAMRGLNYGIQNSINPQINPNVTLDQNYKMMAAAMTEALSTMEIELDDREVGKFVTKTITEEIYN